MMQDRPASSAPLRHGLDRAIDLPAFSEIEIGSERGKSLGPLPANFGFQIFRRKQESRQLGGEPGPNRMRRVLRFFEQGGWDDDIGIDRPERDAKFFRSLSAPAFRFAH